MLGVNFRREIGSALTKCSTNFGGFGICPDNFGPPNIFGGSSSHQFLHSLGHEGLLNWDQVANLDSLRNAHWKEKVVTSMDVTWWQIYDFHVVSEIADMASTCEFLFLFLTYWLQHGDHSMAGAQVH